MRSSRRARTCCRCSRRRRSRRGAGLRDSETRIAQSLEEQTPESQAAFEARAGALNASQVTLLSGGTCGGVVPSQQICTARVAGPAAQPAAVLGTATRFLGFTVAPGPTPNSYSFTATFDGPVTGFDASRFIVRGLQGGVRFAARPTLGTAPPPSPRRTRPSTRARPVELVLKPRACVEGLPYVVRRRLSAAPASGTFPSFGLGFDSGLYPAQIIAADWNGDGRLDVGITSEKNYTLTSWTLNVPENQYQRHSTQLAPAPQKPPTMKTRVAAGDLNGDGVLDFVVLDCWGSRFLVGIGNGDGTFTHHVTHVLSENFGLEALAAGDIDGDGDIDLVATKTVDGRALVVLTNHGTHLSTHGEAFYGATAVGLADVNGDGNRLHGRVGRFPTGRRCEHLLGAIAAPGSDRSRAAGTPRVPSGPSDPFATSGGRGTWSATAPILPHPSAHTSVRSGLRCRRSQSGMQASRHRRNAGPVVRHARG